MADLTRRAVLSGSAIAATGVAALSAAQAIAQEAKGAASVSLEDALRLRRSTRRFAADDLPEEQLLRLLWAGNGVNREEGDGRTAPSWRTAKHVDIYVAREAGVHRYDPAANSLVDVSGDDIRDVVSSASFIQRAPVVLIYVSDRTRLVEAAGEEAAKDEQALAIGAHVNSALISQNIYLFAAAEGLGTVLIGGSADRAATATALKLPETATVTYIQPVGVPR